MTKAGTVTINLGSNSKDKSICFFSLRSGSPAGTSIANNEGISAVAFDHTVTYNLEAGVYYLTAVAFDGVHTSDDTVTTTCLKTDGTELTQGNKTIAGRTIRIYGIVVEYTA